MADLHPEETPVVKTDEPTTDVFAAAFELASQDEKPVTQPEATTVVVDDAAKPAATVPDADDQTNFETPTEPDATVVDNAAKPVATAPVLDDAFLNRFAEIVSKTAPQPQQVQQAPIPAPALFTAEETKFLTDYENDYPDVAKAETLRRRAENQVLVQHIFNQVAQVLRPIQEALGAVSETTYVDQLHKTVPDYDAVRDKVIGWVETQPPYLRAAYEHVISNGTVEEVADLIGRYKQASGVAPAAQVAAVPAQVKKVDSELPASAKKAAAALAPVASKRTAVVQTQAPEDFDGAFEQFAKQV